MIMHFGTGRAGEYGRIPDAPPGIPEGREAWLS
jgi:hypothetical protein